MNIPSKQPMVGRSFAEIFASARLRSSYWMERMELCESKKQRQSLAGEIAALATGAAATDSKKASTAEKDRVRVQRMARLLARWREDANAMMIFADESDSPEREECIERAKVLNDCADAIEREMAGSEANI